MPDEAPCRILIVEDDRALADDLKRVLEELGYETITAAPDGEQALLLSGTLRPDLVLMDVNLRGSLDGIKTAEIIYDVWKIPVIFTSTERSAQSDIFERTRAAGPFGFLLKPFRTGELHATVLVALHQHRLTRDLFARNGWFSTMLNSLSDGVIATDTEGIVKFINPPAERLTGWTGPRALGQPVETIYPLRQLDGVAVAQTPLRVALATLRPVKKALYRLQRVDHTEVAVEDFSSPIIRNGKLVGAVTVFLDATERVQSESEQRRLQNHLEMLVQFTGEELGQTREELRSLSAHLLTAQDGERSRIARDLHDDFAQQTALMSMQLSFIMRSANALPDQTRVELDTLASQIEELSLSLRRFSHSLHPAVLEDLGLAVALEVMVKEWRLRGMDLSVALQGTPDELPHEVATALYRIAQEALSNAARHAAGAPVLLNVAIEQDELVLRVDDAGPGFVRKRRGGTGIGLWNMQERARLIGGVLTVVSGSEQGTSICVRVPYERAGLPRTGSRIALGTP